MPIAHLKKTEEQAIKRVAFFFYLMGLALAVVFAFICFRESTVQSPYFLLFFFLIQTVVWTTIAKLLFALYLRRGLRPLEMLLQHLHFGTGELSAQNGSEFKQICHQISIGLKRFTQLQIAAKQQSLDVPSRLISQMVHDIRTPLQMISLALKYQPNPEVLQNLSERIDHILKDVCGEIRRQFSYCFLPTTMERILEEIKLNFSEMSIRSDKILNIFLSIHSLELQRIISNLVNNAKEADASKIEIRIRMRQNEKVDIAILDNGCGLTPEKVRRINSGVASNSDKVQGQGLGLKLAKEKLAEAGGSFYITSKKGRGTITHIQLNRVCEPAWYINLETLTNRELYRFVGYTFAQSRALASYLKLGNGEIDVISAEEFSNPLLSRKVITFFSFSFAHEYRPIVDDSYSAAVIADLDNTEDIEVFYSHCQIPIILLAGLSKISEGHANSSSSVTKISQKGLHTL